ncbi:MAG: hypothetical protein Q8Q62_04345, partial [Mesorhizobium sp.]|nr:hypothetical protein [Mesorhizobium sp.]
APKVGPVGAASLPSLWLFIVMALSAWGIVQAWRATFDYRLPDFVTNMLYAGIAVDLVTVLAGLYVAGLFWRGSPLFATAFSLWAGFDILTRLGLQVATLFSDVYVVTPVSWIIAAVAIAIDVACIAIVRRTPPSAAPASRPPAGVYLINGFLGAVVGGVLGAVLGFIGGAVIVDWMEVSCFEGGCGYATVAIALLVMLVSTGLGLAIAIRRTRRGAAG